MDNKKYSITCDECKYEFPMSEIKEEKVENIKIDGKTFNITYFKCPTCGKMYLIEMLDYRAEKLKNRYLEIRNSVEKKKAKGLIVSQDRLCEVEKIKSEAIKYQKSLIDNYSDKIPTDCLN